MALSLPTGVGDQGTDAGTSAFFGTSLDVAWEADIWGEISSGQAAALADFQAARATFEGARLSLAGQVTKAWFLATQVWRQLELTRATRDNLQGVLDLTLERQRIGQASEQDVRLTRADVASVEDAVRNLEGAYEDAKRSLEVLLGRYPAAEIEVPLEFIEMPGPVPVGLPSELLQRRPDVIAADRRVAASFARVDSAQAAKLPSLTLTGSLGTASDDLGGALDPANAIWNVGANLLVPILDQGGRQLGVEITNAQQEAAVADYAATGLRAFSEVESTLMQESVLADREGFLEQSAADNREAYRLAEVQYDVGAIDQLSLLQIQTRVFNAESQLVSIQGARLTNRVDLHLALGGSFESPVSESEE
jgi:NodT family efflux transporter outer membrane factor (OMF) lipoprotein